MFFGCLIDVCVFHLLILLANIFHFMQNAGSTLTLSGAALSGVSITSDSVSLSGDLVLDLSGIDVYDGMQFTLVTSNNVTGQWTGVTATSTSDCVEYQVDVTYTQQFAIGTLTTVSLCFGSLKQAMMCFLLV